MTDSEHEAGIIQTLVTRFERFHLPRLLDIKAAMDRGETLSGLDIQFLEEVLRDAQDNQHMADRHPEWQPLAARAVVLYAEITARALENERAAGDRTPDL
jgi:hypothetical protein